MAKRKSIHVAGFGHVNPIPAACRVGNLVMSGGIAGIDPATGKVAPTLEAQCAFMFEHVKTIVEAAGGTPDDIIKLTVWMTDRGQRAALNAEWLKMFPDEHARPARHTMQTPLDGGLLIQCDFTAVLG
ncbi:MAG: RidA family protein [Alphaproteobacteria bacterium]|nr:RidA family protein [Alphaproteobacteria bacterium]